MPSRGCLAFFGGGGKQEATLDPAPSSSAFPTPQPHRKPLGPPAPPVRAAPPSAAQSHAADTLLATPDNRPARVCAALLANAASHPGDARFRRIRLANPRVHACVVCVPGALELLEASGFRVVFESASRRDPEARAEGFAVLSPETPVLGEPARAALAAGVDLLRSALPPNLAATSTFSSLSYGGTGGGGAAPRGAQATVEEDEEDGDASSPPPPAAATSPPRPPLAMRALSRLRSTSTQRVPACGADAAADAACVGHVDGEEEEEGEEAGALVPPPSSGGRRAAAAMAAGLTRATDVLLPRPGDAVQPPAWVTALLPPEARDAAALAASAASARDRLSTPAQRAASLARIASRRGSSAVGGSSSAGGAPPTTRVVVRLPEAVSLAADFQGGDNGAAVHDWVASCLAARKDGGPAPAFELVVGGEGAGPALSKKKGLLASAPGVLPAGLLSLSLHWKGAPPASALLKAGLMGEARVVMV
jgi:hypothetical protein